MLHISDPKSPRALEAGELGPFLHSSFRRFFSGFATSLVALPASTASLPLFHVSFVKFPIYALDGHVAAQLWQLWLRAIS